MAKAEVAHDGGEQHGLIGHSDRRVLFGNSPGSKRRRPSTDTSSQHSLADATLKSIKTVENSADYDPGNRGVGLQSPQQSLDAFITGATLDSKDRAGALRTLACREAILKRQRERERRERNLSSRRRNLRFVQEAPVPKPGIATAWETVKCNQPGGARGVDQSTESCLRKAAASSSYASPNTIATTATACRVRALHPSSCTGHRSLFSPIYAFFQPSKQHMDLSLEHSMARELRTVSPQPKGVVEDRAESEDSCCADERERENDVDHHVKTDDQSSDDEELDESWCENTDPWMIIASLPPLESLTDRPSFRLPPAMSYLQRRPTLVLDLDETLVHCSMEPIPLCDFEFCVLFHGVQYQVFAKLRPHLKAFLEYAAKHFEVVVFTASQQVYADKLLDFIDREGNLIHHRLFRDACLQVDFNFLKDLSVVNRELHKTIIVDNSPQAFGYHLDNGVPIDTWTDDVHDTQLLWLIEVLDDSLHELYSASGDVRRTLRRHFDNADRVGRFRSKILPNSAQTEANRLRHAHT